ncbi:MAG: LamG domain-containing protein [Phaeodactylibacter sp.]|nr:LamG domain-containing protein [Phaeodactylibacter sp.]
MRKIHLFLLVISLFAGGQLEGQNYALSLAQNQEDYINLPLGGTPLAGNPTTFTVECWFYNQNSNPGQFRRLFSLGGTNSRIEVGEQNGQLVYFLLGNGGNIGVNAVTAMPGNVWTHLAVVKNNNQIDFYLDCLFVGSTPSLTAITFNSSTFRLGRWPGGAAANADWHGGVDDLRLWQSALTPADICAQQFCPPPCTDPTLVAYWDFNDPAVNPGGNNTGITQILDCTPNANHGTPVNLIQSGSVSNWINNAPPVVYPVLYDLGLEIRDYPYRNNLLTGICDGDPIHVCLDDNGQTPGPYSNVSVLWEYSDDSGATWLPVGTPSFLDFCFPVVPGEIDIACSGSTAGFVDRKYRAISTVSGAGGQLCDYISDEYDLQICCPISPATVSINPSGPFCEGETTNFQVCLNSPDPFVNTPGPNVTIDWFYVDPVLGSTPIPSAANQICFNYNGWTAPFPPGGLPADYCFQAQVRNCQGKLETFSACVTVDPQPVCGTIEGFPLGAPQNLNQIGTTPLTYEICPGADAILGIATPFQYCSPQWQYTFVDPTLATPSDWVNMGFSNAIQNTNILPSYYWPTGADRIYYRIQCNPLSSPSACDPCLSDWIEIRLIPAPAVPMITGPTQECVENLPVTLSVTSPMPGETYTWLWEGLVVGTGTSINVTQGGCYWLEASNGCQTVEGPQHCLAVCETIARLSCPQSPNECAEPGTPIT